MEEALAVERQLHEFFSVAQNSHFVNKQFGMGWNWSHPQKVWDNYTEDERRERGEKMRGIPRTKVWKKRASDSNKRAKRKHWKQEWWDAVREKVEIYGDAYLWGKQEILDQFPDVSERTLRRMRKDILEQNE